MSKSIFQETWIARWICSWLNHKKDLMGIQNWSDIFFQVDMNQFRDFWGSCFFRRFSVCLKLAAGFPGGSAVKKKKKSTCITGSSGSFPELGRSPEEGNNSALTLLFLLANPMDRWARPAILHGVQKSRIRLSD